MPTQGKAGAPARLTITGVATPILIAATATILGRYTPAVGAVPWALGLGMVIAAIRPARASSTPSYTFVSTTLLHVAIVLLGVRLSLTDVATLGLATLPVMLTTLAVCLIGATLLGPILKISRKLTTLIGVGTGICGATAIATIAPIIGATAVEISYAVSVVFIFNIAALIAYPIIGQLLNYDATQFGIFAGTAVNDTSSVVATAAAFGITAINVAIVVKLVRTIMIVPISMALAAKEARATEQHTHKEKHHTTNTHGTTTIHATTTQQKLRALPQKIAHKARLIPKFLGLFLVVVAINSTGLIPDGIVAPASALSTFLIAAAMSAIGLQTHFAVMKTNGTRPLLLGALLWVLVAATTITMLALT
ncbi:YeiH family protein [Timonella sp. A28]|uniref:YeiH family protein n=1 Tax=Timonella sp. A28 TaxID=3442640 RepID=UPI003EB885D7